MEPFLPGALYSCANFGGKNYQFVYAERLIKISMPHAVWIPPPGLKPRLMGEFDEISCHSRHKNQNGEYVPTQYDVHCVDVAVALAEPIEVPGEFLQLPPNRYELVTESKKTELSKLAQENSRLASNAFAYWLTVLRWKSGIGHIGEPRIRDAGQKTGGEALRSNETNHRFWLPDMVFVIPRHDIVTEEHWNAAQEAFSNGKGPPVWFDFLFQSEQRLNNLDLTGAILSLAIALEVSVRILATLHLGDLGVETVIREIIDTANLRAILNRVQN